MSHPLRTRRSSDLGDAFVDALACNWLVAAPDAHAKNYALLLEGPQARLAPLHDIASALAYPDFHLPKLKMAMKIGGYYRLSAIGRQAWIRLSENLRLDREVVLYRISGLIERISDAFDIAAGEPGVGALHIHLPHRHCRAGYSQ